MANYKEDIVDIELSNGNLFRSFISYAIGSGDALANRFGVQVFRNGEPMNLTGTCQGYFIRSDGATVPITNGVINGNVAYVTLIDTCYAVEGIFSLAIKVTSGGETVTLRIVDGIVSRTITNATVDPGTIIPSIETLIAQINAAVASIPADYSTLWLKLAPAFSADASYISGQYVTYDGNLYVFKTEHSGAWSSSDVTAVDIGGELFDLKGKLDVYPDPYENLLSPVKSILNGMKWKDGVLVNNITDTRTYIQFVCEKINGSGTATTVGSKSITEAETVKFVTYCDSNTKFIQLRHSGSTRDLYVRFPINLSHGCEVIITCDVSDVDPRTAEGFKIKNISAITYATNKWSASIDGLHHLNIPGDAIPEFLQTGSNFIVKIKMSNDEVFTNIPDTGKTKTAAQVITDLPDNASYNDGVLTIQIGLTQSLMYDYENNKFEVVTNTSSSIPKQNHLVLVESFYGNIYGDWVNKAAYKNQLLRPFVYIGDRKAFTYVNRTNGSVDVYLSTGISFISQSGASTTISQSDIVAQLGSSVASITEGVLDIKIAYYQGLFFDAINERLYMGLAGQRKLGSIPLLLNAWGSLYGELFNPYFRNKFEEADTHFRELDSLVKLPDYYLNEVNDTANKLSKLPATNFNYLAFTDIHYSYPTEFTSAKLKQLMETIERLANGANIDAVLFLGDIIEGGSTADRSKSDAQFNEVFEGLRGINKPVLCLFGNHDNNMYDFANSSAASYRNTDHYITMNEWKNKAVLPFGIGADYYCKDFPNKNMRVIVSNTCDYRESVDASGNVTITDGAELIIRRDQVDAIADMMNESTYDMIVFAHGMLADILSLISKYNSRETYTKANGTVIDFADKTHEVILYHTGHYHNSALERNEGYNINILSTSCASMATAQQTLYSASPTTFVTNWEDDGPVAWNARVIPRTKNTANETCYDVVSVGDGKINKIGFGASADGSLNID